MSTHQTYQKIDYTTHPLESEYENCIFENCNFHSVRLSQITFENCRFLNCDMSLIDISGTILDAVVFENCKLIGIRFDLLSTFLLSVDFRGCLLKFSVFDRLKLKKTIFKDCDCEEMSFIETNLTESIFEKCNLRGAIFEKTNLEKVDLRSSYAYVIDPEKNQIKQAKFSSTGVLGLLAKYDIVIE